MGSRQSVSLASNLAASYFFNPIVFRNRREDYQNTEFDLEEAPSNFSIYEYYKTCVIKKKNTPNPDRTGGNRGESYSPMSLVLRPPQ